MLLLFPLQKRKEKNIMVGFKHFVDAVWYHLGYSPIGKNIGNTIYQLRIVDIHVIYL